MRFAFRSVGMVLLAAALSACPGICGHSTFRAAPSEDLQKWQNDAGVVTLTELCGIDYGANAIDRPDLKFTTLVLDANVPDAELRDDLRVSSVLLPAASVVFANKHLKAGEKVEFKQLAGSGLHKMSEAALYAVYPLTAGTVTILEGPRNHKEDTFDGNTTFSEEWKMSWSLDYGNGMQHWDGEDWVQRIDGNTVGTPLFLPPDLNEP